jgi:hypothetical protein
VLALRWDDPDPPPRWGVVIGEIVHDLRSALDHLVWQMVLANNGQPQAGRRGCPGHSFPVWTDGPAAGSTFAAVVTRAKTGKLRDVHPDHVAAVEYFQPYLRNLQPGSPPDEQPFAILDELWNRDKHRLLLAAFVSPTETPDVGLREITPNHDADRLVDSGVLWGKPLRDGSVFAWIQIEPRGPNPDFSANLDFPASAEIEGTGLDLQDALNLCGRAVSSVIETAAGIPPF